MGRTKQESVEQKPNGISIVITLTVCGGQKGKKKKEGD